MTERDELIEMASGAASTSYEQRKAIAELGKLDDQTSLQALVGLLSDDDRYLRREVVKAIGTHGSSSAVLALIHCLSDGSENVRRDAAALLGGRNDGRAVAPLRVLLDDKGYAVRHAAENSLELLDREGVEPAGFDSEALASFSSAIAASPVEPEPNVLSAPQSESKAENPAGQNHSNTAASVEAATQPSKGETESQDLSRKPQHEDQKSLDHLEGRFQNSEPPVNRVAESEPLTHAAEPESDKPPHSSAHVTRAPGTPDHTSTGSGSPSTDPETNQPAVSTDDGSAFEEEVLLAELVAEHTEATIPPPTSELNTFEQPHPEIPLEQLLSPTPPAQFDWKSAKRFNLLFEQKLASLQSHYADLHANQAETIRSENRYERALLQHDLTYADLADDVRETKQQTDQILQDGKEAHDQSESLTALLKQSKRASAGIASLIANLFWPDRTHLVKQNGEHLKAKLKRANDSLANARNSLSRKQAESDSANQPLRDAEKELLAASQALTRTQKKVRTIRNSIDNKILSALNNQNQETLETFIAQSPQRDALRQCIAELRQHQVEHRAIKNALSELDSPLNEDKQRFTDATAQVAASIGAGFVIASRKEKVQSNVKCSVEFRAASVTTSPSHRLEGKAQGRAKLSSNYEYQEISWKEDEKLRESLNTLSTTATQLGSIQALHAVRSTEVASSVYSIKNCVAFIRSELEKDFEDNP